MSRNEAYFNADTNTWEFRGSSFGGCLHGLVMALQGATKAPPDLRTRQRFSAGTLSEERIKEDMIAIGAASPGKPEPNVLGRMWDAGKIYKTQRAVRGSYINGPDANKWVCSDYVIPAKHDHCVVQCSLDGWGIGAHEFLDRVEPIYTEGMVGSHQLPSDFQSWIWEHKSMTREKFETLLKCCFAGEEWVVSPSLFAQAFPQYSWQLTAQALGVHSMLWDVFRDVDPELSSVGGLAFVQPRIFFSVELLDYAAGDWIPAGRYLFYIVSNPFTGTDVAVRLAEVIRMFRAGEVPRCDSEFKCDWPLPAPPKRTGNGPAPSEAPRGAYKYVPPAEDLSELAALG